MNNARDATPDARRGKPAVDAAQVPGPGGSTERAALAIAVVVLLATGLSPVAIPQVVAQQDKLHHVAGFFVFVWALRAAFPHLGIGAVLAAGAGVAFVIEAAQLLLPLRTASPGDLLAGVVGVVLGCALRTGRRSRGAADGAAT